ncbi:uncharacterized protein MYCFIDRAFT_210692 [Pseudocercospora fijiensis CIRAD86]|uniref:Uncharacterized protein n=1 Tax=Pseudocercospora fijiensis (strain CIRAD86) TaxID=383855 RepID=M3A7Q1_PSEFD|nr:uncharacterized protein MYCFIDRAFT_210692 [Pseudocercospora fijiensis CIRAD86]EME87109.1 hypothetical protein MYCFIDRAFT_210692 [Pseudocercospora fijiensis CIRAD86]
MGVDHDSAHAQHGEHYPYGTAMSSSYASASYPSVPAPPASQHSKPRCGQHQRDAPIDVTEDTRKKRKGKRKSAGVDDEDNGDGKSAKKKAKSKDEEKRLKRWRPRAPNAYHEIRSRALTQRMFVIDRQRHPPDDNVEESQRHPTETLSIAGTTGNIYTIVIDKKPTCDCPHAKKGNQCKHVIYALARVLRVRADLEYQLAFISSELREIFEKAPPLPTATGDETAKDGNRKPVEGECPICCVDFEPENAKEEIVYCKAACGNNIHKECFAQWAATKTNGNVTCPFCRTPWESDEDTVKTVAKTGQKNAEGYVNVAGQLGLSGRRDYSTYNEFWLRRQGRYYDDY